MEGYMLGFGAKHFHRGKYRVYGEGSIHHSGHPCEHGLGLDRHPLITREDWPSRRAFWRTQVANWYMHRRMRRLIWPDGQEERMVGSMLVRGPVPVSPPMAVFRYSPFDRPMAKLFGPPYRRVPRVEAALRPEDSVYDRTDMIARNAD